MGTFVAFTLYSGIFLLVFYIAYRLCASREKQFKLNRTILISIYIVSLSAWHLRGVEYDLSGLIIEREMASGLLSTKNIEVPIKMIPIATSILIGIYFFGMIATLVLTLMNISKTLLIIKKGFKISKQGYTLVMLPNASISPFSFFKYIVTGVSDLSECRKCVMAHELAHIKSRHFIDLILAQTVCIVFWYNPAAWGMRKELALLHEFQADTDVLASGVNKQEYLMLLIREASDKRHRSLANSLLHSDLKNRISMMQKEGGNGNFRLKSIALVLAPVFAGCILKTPIMGMEIDKLSSFKFSDISRNKDVKKEPEISFVDIDGNPITASMIVTNEKYTTKDEETPIFIPIDLSERKGLNFIVNGKLLDTPEIIVNGEIWTKQVEDIDTEKIESISFRKGIDDSPNGIVDITLKK